MSTTTSPELVHTPAPETANTMVVHQDPPTMQIVPQSQRMGLLPTAHEYKVYLELAEKFIESGFMPKAIKQPAQALAIMLTGRELGLMPMQSLRMLHVIEGKPGMAAELQLGRFKQAGGRFRWLETNEKVARIQVIAPGDPVEWAQTFEFTWEEAKRAEVTGKDNWRKYPAAMLRARAASLAIRAVAPDVSAGLYDPDELGEVTNEAGDPEWPEPRPTPSEFAAESRTEAVRDRAFDDDPVLPVTPMMSGDIRLSDPRCHVGVVLGFMAVVSKNGEAVKKYAPLIQKCWQSIAPKVAEADLALLTKVNDWVAADPSREKMFPEAYAAIVDRMEKLSLAAEMPTNTPEPPKDYRAPKAAAESDPAELFDEGSISAGPVDEFDEAGPGGTFEIDAAEAERLELGG